MVFGVYHILHTHGVVPFIGALAAIKAVKLKLVLWRRGVLNDRVKDAVESRLQPPLTLDESDDSRMILEKHEVPSADVQISCPGSAMQAQGDGGSGGPEVLCAECNAPLWLRKDDTEEIVKLNGCGCLLHSGCLLELATKEHGVNVPHITDLDHAMVQLRRMFGIDSISVSGISCPACQGLSSSWRKLQGEVVQVVHQGAKPLDVAKALKRRDALSVQGLCSAIQEVSRHRRPEPDMVSKLCKRSCGNFLSWDVRGQLADRWEQWEAAAVSGESRLLTLLRQDGLGSADDLAEFVLAAAAQMEGHGTEKMKPVRRCERVSFPSSLSQVRPSTPPLTTEQTEAFSGFLLGPQKLGC